jgi:hypothetical protein
LISKASAATLIPLCTEAPAPEGHLEALAEGLKPHLPISVLLLGHGRRHAYREPFPGADNLEAALDDHAPPLMAMRAEAAGEPRVTLTAPVLKGAMSTHVLITGAEKREAIERAAKMHADGRADRLRAGAGNGSLGGVRDMTLFDDLRASPGAANLGLVDPVAVRSRRDGRRFRPRPRGCCSTIPRRNSTPRR